MTCQDIANHFRVNKTVAYRLAQLLIAKEVASLLREMHNVLGPNITSQRRSHAADK